MDNKLDEIRPKLTQAFSLLGFSPDQVQKQVEDLGEVISQSILMRIVNEHISQKNEILNNFDDFIKSTYPDEEFQKIVEEESVKIAKEYLDSITDNLDQNKKNNFLAAIQI